MDISKLTMGEMAEVERRTGQSATDLGKDGKPQYALMIALAFIAKRREDPSFTYSQAEAITSEEFGEIFTAPEEADPKAVTGSKN